MPTHDPTASKLLNRIAALATERPEEVRMKSTFAWAAMTAFGCLAACDVSGPEAPTLGSSEAEGAIHGTWQIQPGSMTISTYAMVTPDPGPGSNYFYALSGALIGSDENAGRHGFYIGLQTDMRDPSNNLVGRGLVFSIWNAVGATWGTPGGWCAPFDGEGTGMSCRFPFNWREGVAYYMTVGTAGLSPDGFPMWQGLVLETDTGAVIDLGTIHSTPTDAQMSVWGSSWIEHHEPFHDCSIMHTTGVWFTPPGSHGDSAAGAFSGNDPPHWCNGAEISGEGVLHATFGPGQGQGAGAPCGIDGEFAGSCIDQSVGCNGSIMAGLCPGPANIVCCGNPPG